MKDTWMRRLSRVLFKAMSYRSPAIAVPSRGAVLSAVTVVNPGQEKRRGQTLVVAGERIAGISAHAPADVAREEHAADGYVLPGLVDMHVHIPPLARDLAGLLFLAHGVTTVRETGDADGTTWLARRRIQAGEVPGPRIFASGPVLDGAPPFLPTSWPVRNAAEARDAVATLAAQGADFVKIHHKLSAEALAGIRAAAAEHGLRVAGHTPRSVPFEEVRIWDVQHLDGLRPYAEPDEGAQEAQERWRGQAPARIAFYARVSQEQGLVHTPTLSTSKSLIWQAKGGPPPDVPLGRLPRCYQAVWQQMSRMATFGYFSGKSEVFQQELALDLEAVRTLHRAGVRLHLGTDTAAMPFLVPGDSLQRELALFVEAGLSLEDAWVAGTRAAGESLGLPLLGTVQEGAPADLLIFREDPTCDLAALATLQGVVAQGRFYSKEFLDQALLRHRERFERPLYDRLSTAFVRLMLRMV